MTIRRMLLYAALAAAVAALLAALFLATFARREVTVYTPPRGAALSNRYFALEQVLHSLGMVATSPTRLDGRQPPLAARDTLLLDVDPARVDAATAGRLAGWVRGGGHLLLAVEHLGRDTPPLLADLGLAAMPTGGRDCSPRREPKAATEWCGRRFRLPAAATARLQDAVGDAGAGYLLARFAVGRGHVTLVADFAPLRGQALRQAGNRRLALRLLQPNWRRGAVRLVSVLDGASFPVTALRRGWPGLLSLAILLAAWAGMRAARLGPLLPAPVPHRRALLEHVQAAGGFLYRRDLGVSLHRLACEAVLAHGRRCDPGLALLHGAALHARLAERSRLDARQVARAFESPAGAPAFCQSIRVLARIRSHA